MCAPLVHKIPMSIKGNIHRGGDAIMLTLEGLIAVISLCVSIYSLGYSNGKKDTKKQPPKRPN